MKASNGLTKLYPSVFMFLCYITALSLMTFVLKRIELGTAYAVFSGVGVFLMGLIGIFFNNEPATLLRIGCMLLIIIGVVGLNLMSKA